MLETYAARPVWDASGYEPEIKARDRGMARAASAHHTDLRLAREIARELGRRIGPDGKCVPVCADDVRAEMLRRWPDTAWGNWAGSIFAAQEWVFVDFTRSTAPGSHANLLRTWRLR